MAGLLSNRLSEQTKLDMKALFITSLEEEVEQLFNELYIMFVGYKDQDILRKEIEDLLSDLDEKITLSYLKPIFDLVIYGKLMTPVRDFITFSYLCSEVRMLLLALRKNEKSKSFMEYIVYRNEDIKVLKQIYAEVQRLKYSQNGASASGTAMQ